jgi:hypothetical protein
MDFSTRAPPEARTHARGERVMVDAVTASSDEVAAVGAAFVQLKLVVTHEGATQPQHIAMGAWPSAGNR